MVDKAIVRAVVVEHIQAHGYDGTLTARVVREETERRMGLPQGGLVEHKDTLLKAIEEVIGEQPKPSSGTEAPTPGQAPGQAAATEAECAAARAAVEADAEAAERLLRETEAATQPSEAESCLERLEAAAASRTAAERLVAAQLVGRLAPRLKPGSDKKLAALAVRVLTAASLHDGLTAQMLKAAELAAMLIEALVAATDALAIPLVDLMHNLADSDANRLRLIAAGCLPAVTRLLLAPSGSSTLKEHALNAAASLAGVPDTELSFPEILARCCASRIPGIQREGLRSMQLVAARSDLAPRLAQVDGLKEALRAAATSRDAACAQSAAELIEVLKV